MNDETRDLIRVDYARMKHNGSTISTIAQLHAVTGRQVIEALGDAYKPDETPFGRLRTSYSSRLAQEVLGKVASGEMKHEQACKELHISPSTLQKWLDTYKAARSDTVCDAPAEAPAAPAEPAAAKATTQAPAEQGRAAALAEENIRTYMASLDEALRELSRYGLLDKDACDYFFKGLQRSAEGFMAGLRFAAHEQGKGAGSTDTEK